VSTLIEDKPCFYTMLCRERGAPADWRWFSLKVLGNDYKDRTNGAVLVEGACAPPNYTRGQWKGTPNWKKRDKATDRQFVITMRDYDARKEQWERDTGKCFECYGSGQSFASTGRDGTKYRDCRRCNATGSTLIRTSRETQGEGVES